MSRYLIAGVTVLVAACSIGPTTKEDVCQSFTELGNSVLKANGIADNAIFRNADRLSGIAMRYQGGTTLKSDADALARIADSGRTNGLELMTATTGIAKLCGHPLALDSLLSGNR
ncbi:hypothetical protein Lesp02_13400 [Lentzea sp. NBRC 105346]|uniref:hypothetical protein n=1 Tax=Lentzea sp. NBRC 105346 TaxID=3032205 RepID=UPI0024A460A5|nr:hypothetical protein [Lentzea sp. NBRC 105346]GLZ29150.1 hypothetical protein Lesp02_13400 [Lentzea sp. NBRC 105346]